jgi:biopolymer transport protein ExbD
MAFGSFDNAGGSQPMSEINVTPLVDVMLVLVIIFIVTAPLLTHGIKIELPKASSTVNPEQPDTVTLSIDAEGQAFWNDQAIRAEDLPRVMAEAARQDPQPELHLRADRNTRYQQLAEVMSQARNAGLTKLGFVTDPGSHSGPPPAEP